MCVKAETQMEWYVIKNFSALPVCLRYCHVSLRSYKITKNNNNRIWNSERDDEIVEAVQDEHDTVYTTKQCYIL